jgi:hypothetical protein
MPSELAFRAQLVMSEQREIYDYWRSAAGTRPMPGRADLDPALVGHLLPGISLLDVGPRHDALRYRLAGSRLREIYGIEVTGLSVFDLNLGPRTSYWRAAFRRVVDEGTPMQGAVKGPVRGRDHIVLFWLRLPLSDDGVRVDKILCYDVGIPVIVGQSPEEAERMPKSGNLVSDKTAVTTDN